MVRSEGSSQGLLLSVIVPVYDEIATVGAVLKRVKAQKIDGVSLEVIVVDDGSRDGTREFLEKNQDLYSLLIKNAANLGKGGAIKKGLLAAKGDYVVFQDADLEYDPNEYGALLRPVLRFNADVVMGSRFLDPSWVRVSYFWHKVGNKIITFWFNLWYNTTWTDVYSCYILFRRDLLEARALATGGWQQQAEILGKICRQAKRLYEVPVSYNGRSYEEGKKLRWHHALPVLLTIIRARVSG